MSSYPSITEQASEQLLAYQLRYPEEFSGVSALGTQLQTSPDQMCSRSNMAGHITASGLVLAQCERGRSHALLIHHKALQRWLTPGGHIELGVPEKGEDAARANRLGVNTQTGNLHGNKAAAPRRSPAAPPPWAAKGDQTLWDAAMREVVEETGVRDLQPMPFGEVSARAAPQTANDQPLELPVVFDIDTHFIPANPARGEGAHLHHDFMFLAKAGSLAPLKPQRAEVNSARWMPTIQLASMSSPRMDRVLRKIHLLGLT